MTIPEPIYGLSLLNLKIVLNTKYLIQHLFLVMRYWFKNVSEIHPSDGFFLKQDILKIDIPFSSLNSHSYRRFVSTFTTKGIKTLKLDVIPITTLLRYIVSSLDSPSWANLTTRELVYPINRSTTEREYTVLGSQIRKSNIFFKIFQKIPTDNKTSKLIHKRPKV